MHTGATLTSVVIVLGGLYCAGQTPKHTVSGKVLDGSNNPVVGARVQAYRDEHKVGKYAISDVQGSYSIDFEDGKPIDSVRYDHSDWYPGVVEDISGRNDHTLHKVLYKRGEKLTVFQAQEVVSAFERIVEIDKRTGQLQSNFEQYRYAAALEEIGALSLPESLHERTKQIMVQAPLRMPSPRPEHERLRYFVGTWKSEAEMRPSAFGPGGKFTSTDRNTMLGDFFVVIHSEGTGPLGATKEVAILGYDTRQKLYTYDVFNSLGEHTTAKGIVSGDTWTWTSPEEERGGKKVKGRFILKEVSPTVYTYTFETSTDGGPWTNVMEGRSTKLK